MQYSKILGYIIVLLLLIITVWGVNAATLNVPEDYSTIQSAINVANTGDVIEVAAGTYNERLNLQGKSLMINGAGSELTVINTSSFTDNNYAIHNFGSSSIIKNLKLIGVGGTGNAKYGFKISHVNNITLESIKVENSYKTGIDFNSVNDSILINVEVANTVSGFGIMVFESNNITVTNVTTDGNAWGGVSVQAKSSPSDNIKFFGIFNTQESVSLLIEQDPPGYANITNLQVPEKFNYVVYGLRNGDNYKQEFYQETLENSKSFAQAILSSHSDVLIYDVSESSYYVEPGMSVQNAIGSASDGDIINVGSGTYTENLIINKEVELIGTDAIINGDHRIEANNVFISGFEFDLTDSPSVGFYLTDVSGVEIKNNTFNGPDTMICNPWKIGGYYENPIGYNVSNFLFENNEVNKCSIPINLQDNTLNNITINNNVFRGTDGVVYVWAQAGSTPTGILSNFVFTNNDVDSTNSYGIGISDSALNTIYTDDNFGIGNKINNNKFVGIPGAYGFKSVSILANLTNFVFDATQNYFGTPTKSIIGGLIEGDINFEPYYINEEMTSLSDEFPYVDASSDEIKGTSFLKSVFATLSGIANYVWYQISGSGTINFTNQIENNVTILTDDDGTYVIGVNVTDVNTNNTVSDNFTLTWDTTVPTSTINSPEEGTWFNDDFEVSLTDSDGLSGLSLCRYRVRSLINGTWSVTKNLGDRGCSIPVTLQVGFNSSDHCESEGENACRIEAFAIDNASNGGDGVNNISRYFSIDLTKPVVTIDNTIPTNNEEITITGTFIETNIENITINGVLATLDLDNETYLAVVELTQEGLNTITVIATDKAGNTETETSSAILNTQMPVITLLGNNPQVIKLGDEYTEFGATAFDDSDGNLSANMTINNSEVDTETVGTYEVTYNVTDSAGNVKEITRTVIVSDIPITANFTSNVNFSDSSTNLSAVPDFKLTSNTGEINFGDNILNLTNVIDLDNTVKIENGIIAVDGNAFDINEPVTITLKGLSYSTVPKIFYNSGFTTNAGSITEECSFCEILNYTKFPTTNGTLVFTVEHFTSFKVGGSGEIYDINDYPSLDACVNGKIGDLELDVKEPDEGDNFGMGDTIELDFEVDNVNNDKRVIVEAVLYEVGEDNEVESYDDSKKIGEDEKERFNFDIEVPDDFDSSGRYLVFIKAYEKDNEENHCIQGLIGLDLEREKDDLRVTEIKMSSLEVYSGSVLELKAEVRNFGSDEQKDAYIEVYNKDLEISSKSESFDLEEFGEDDKVTKLISVNIPEGIKEGNYSLMVRVVYGGNYNEKIQEFNISSNTIIMPSIKLGNEKVTVLGTGMVTGSAFSEGGIAISLVVLVIFTACLIVIVYSTKFRAKKRAIETSSY